MLVAYFFYNTPTEHFQERQPAASVVCKG